MNFQDQHMNIEILFFLLNATTKTQLYKKRSEKLIENIGNYVNKLDLYKGCEWTKCSQVRFQVQIAILEMIYDINFRGQLSYSFGMEWDRTTNRWALGGIV